MNIAPALAATSAPPVMEARRWMAYASPDLPLMNVSQAAPVDPPPEPLRREIARMVLEEPGAHLYGPVLGLPDLRDEVAARWSEAYGGTVSPAQVAITAGCNQAFCTVMATLAERGDNAILPTPFYFNHQMWLTQTGVEPRYLPTGEGLIPDPEESAALIDGRTRAIVLVTPNNPGGAEYPAETLRAFMDLCQSRGIALIVDETYRDFDSREGAPHDLLSDPDWDDTLIQLYSFSKAYRLTGHRTGAILASEERLREAEKILDCVTICAPQVGQRAALWGLRNLGEWLAGERLEILDRSAAMRSAMERLDGWETLGCGAYFAYVRQPLGPSDRVAPALVRDAGILLLPGTMFRPDGGGADEARIAFANLDAAGIAGLAERLADVTASGLRL